MDKQPKRLCKSSTDKMLFGVCSGIADYFNIDPTIIRIIWAALVLLYGAGLLAYFICAIVLPEGPTRYNSSDYKNNTVDVTVESEDEPYTEVEVVTEKIDKELRKNGELEDEYL